jgi:alpha-glucosidase
VWPGRTVFPDLCREEVRAWWGELNARHVSSGIAGIWNDMNEPATGGVEPFSMRFDRDGQNYSHERFHNQYALLMAMGTFEGLMDARPDERPFILSRAGFAGIQRYAAQWTGDNQSEWSHLEMSLPMSLGLGLSGQPFVGSDIPGFFGKPSAELSARWAQYGALTPFCRYHNNAGETDQYPWSFGNGVERRSRSAIRLRYQLLPYLYSSFMRAHATGAPIQRPLVYEFQQDRQARETEDSFLLGDSLLVAPVLEAGRTARNVYLPEGTWVDWYTGECCEGGQYITAPAPLDLIPLFGRGGTVVPTYDAPPLSTMGHAPTSLDLHLFVPLEDGETTSWLHEDDGQSFAYREGAFLRTKFVLTRKGKTVTLVGSTEGSGFAAHQRTRFRCLLHGAPVLDAAELDGGRVALERGAISFENRGESFTLSLNLRV